MQIVSSKGGGDTPGGRGCRAGAVTAWGGGRRRRDGCGGAGGAARREGLAGDLHGRLRPGRVRAGAPAGQRLLRGAGGAVQREGRGAGDAGGEGRVLRELVPAGRPHGAPREPAGSRAAGGAGGDRAAVPAADAAGGGGAGAQLDPLRLPRPAHRRGPEEFAGGGRGVPAGAVVGPGEPRPAAPLAGHPALNGPGSAVPCRPPPPSASARGAALRLRLPAVPAPLHRRPRFPLGAPGNDGRPAPPAGHQRPFSLEAGQEAGGRPPAAAPEVQGWARGGRPPPGPAWPAAPGQGPGAKRRRLLQRGGHSGQRWLPAAGGTAGLAGGGFQLVGSGGRGPEERGAPKAPHRLLPPHVQLASASPALRQKSVVWDRNAPRSPDTERVWDACFYPPLPKARPSGPGSLREVYSH